MTADPRFAYTSRGELERDERGRPVIRSNARKGQHEMPNRNAVPKAAIEATERTPGADELADRPLQIGPRDAMNADEFDPAIDYVPDLEEKGYHTGLVRQPAAPIGGEGELRGFEATGIAGDSRFAYGSLAHLKAVHNESEGDDSRYAGRAPSNPDAFDASRLRAAEQRSIAHGPTDGGQTATADDQPTKADLRARLAELGAEDPPQRATHEELTAAVADAEKGQTGADSFPDES